MIFKVISALKSVQKYNFISIYFLFSLKNITFATNL